MYYYPLDERCFSHLNFAADFRSKFILQLELKMVGKRANSLWDDSVICGARPTYKRLYLDALVESL